jgi:hypothetical protein
MEPTIKKTPEPGSISSVGSTKTGAGLSSDPLRSATDPFGYESKEPKTDWERDLKSATQKGAEIADQAKQTITEAYDKTGKALGATYERARDYGTENPGTMTLLALGVGVGLGYILAQNSRIGSRSRARRIVPPVMNAVSQVVAELFD